MSFSETFVRRPVATTLLTLALALSGGISYFLLPVSPLPQVEFPTIQVQASLPGSSPENMASAVATPLERQFGRIAGVTEMNSTSFLGSTQVTLQFDLTRSIDAAARDVQAAINAARNQLPANLPANPTYRKVNPADAPIMILAISSELYSVGEMYDAAASILQQKVSQVQGVGQVNVGGGALPAVRVDVNPTLLNGLRLGLDDVRLALVRANANKPKGSIDQGGKTWSIAATDQLLHAKEYGALVVAYRRGAPIRLQDVATVFDSIEDLRTGGFANGIPAVLLVVFRQPGANIIDTVDRVREITPQLQAEIPAGMKLEVVLDRTSTIRASVHEVTFTMLVSILLVIGVVFVFLRDVRTTLIPAVTVPLSLVGTFGVMYLCGYSIDNLSLMALTIATGFVVDDAIVVIENVMRHIEEGKGPLAATLDGVKEIGFTVVSITVSLVAVFIPLLMMGGIVGRLFREFAVTLSVSIVVSLVISLTTTPMMCSLLLKPHDPTRRQPLFFRLSEGAFELVLRRYERMLAWVLRHRTLVLFIAIAMVGLDVWLALTIKRGFFPQQDTGRLSGTLRADQGASSQATRRYLRQYAQAVQEDPAVSAVIAFSGGGGGGGSAANQGRMFVVLKPLAERKMSADEVNARLRTRLSKLAGASLTFQPVQDLRIGGFPGGAQYQYTLRGDDLAELNEWSPKVLNRLRKIAALADVQSDQQDRGRQARVHIDRDTAARLGVTTQAADDALYDAFGQRLVSTMYRSLNQYRVVLEVDPAHGQSPDGLKLVHARGANGARVPLGAFAQFGPANTLLSVTHQGQFPSVTISFNLKPGFSLGEASEEIRQAERELGLPATLRGSFQGTAQAFEEMKAGLWLLLLAALVAVYIVLGVLYESLVHPFTIISTLPSAGVGAFLALMFFKIELGLIGFIGIILLIGIVKKNAIMMIDFALDAERTKGMTPEQAIFEACLRRFRPITMTTLAALLGALPLALGQGVGYELRQPLGIAIVGGLIFSQALTLFTTPVVYLALDKLRWRSRAA